MKKILFLCTHNSARSQLAEGLANHLFPHTVRAYSAGTEATRVDPYAVSVMSEINIDITKQYSKTIDAFKGEIFDLVVTVCDNAQKACPFFPGAKQTMHKAFKDPSAVQGSNEQKLAAFRAVREEILFWLKALFS